MHCMLLVKILLTIASNACLHSEKDYNAEFDYFLRGKESLRMDVSVPEMARLNKEQVQLNLEFTHIF